MADHCGKDGDDKISDREYIQDRVKQRLSLGAVGIREFPHKQVGIKQEDDETHLGDRPQKGNQVFGFDFFHLIFLGFSIYR